MLYTNVSLWRAIYPGKYRLSESNDKALEKGANVM